ncbi:MAG: hypothetical protein FWG89_09620 [Treponema sp.]|nr:hypothetical protein [Treponema sp.]
MTDFKRYITQLADISPMACLSGGWMLIMASDRLAHAIIAAAALVWVYCLTSLAVHAGIRFFPKRGKNVLLVFLASFIASIYIFLIWVFSPLCALQTFFVVSLIPFLYLGQGTFRKYAALNLKEKFFESLSDALILGSLIVVFSLIREPLGFLSLSLPGSAHGIILLFSFKSDALLPVHILASSSGALLLMGYFLGLYRYYRAKNAVKGGI